MEILYSARGRGGSKYLFAYFRGGRRGVAYV